MTSSLPSFGYMAYLQDVLKYNKKYPEQRRGQACYNLLVLTRPDLTDRLPVGLDPFYLDERIHDFLKWVRENW